MHEDLTIRPYLLRAVYEWCVDTKHTPYLIVENGRDDVSLPKSSVGEKNTVLNIDGEAVRDMVMADDVVSFTARFQGATFHVHVPMGAIVGIFAKETGSGLSFSPVGGQSQKKQSAHEGEKPKLKIV
ncbi:ClpXP protease specificity-enhancing factor SspB [Candidatus Persebacteraceae bacterium Df01]|jgi:stringent starvation protein B|uniref:ClpXP protease specificity-enhancing factor SspB n=1 Tax=Candidatus Doriopsillibacter californiensis TaxID=2970740 RepID=A0ABT7QJW0_9GAMM|nr:ClpXP protease specificity-enhancing factor SspB [Candidatus Persebacteraceae bacterium Df01]